ncbi:DUF393 domain-containing protein [Aestuariimicrobium sp. p3-SID1156]|uniref:thiol-disulfide oxidoreductase DCC family protein n=1 Tax=Aestuariimicrobium sp. p3-SID1156 TaxID=2916038 RepID=UPI00223BCBE4|nr:DUF393 domain-containing protein [Aestuariimicrobium sp. p3-SID1156]MCT1459260.1 DUF393 domain-containing protein [Aestuariimicrobium sp. p3-SID1156]
MPELPPLPVMLHDADCGFCSRCARLVPRLGCRIRVSSLQSEDLLALGVDPERAIVEMPVVLSTGRVAWGHQAWAEILLTGTLPLRVIGRVLGARVMRRPAAAVYRWVAGNRHRMPGGSAACALPVERP